MRVALYEDRQATAFGPLTMLRPVFELICGRVSVRERLVGQPGREWGAWVRPPLVEAYQEAQPLARVNDEDWLTDDETVLVNGRWIPAGALPSGLSRQDVAVCDGEPVCLMAEPSELQGWNPACDETHLLRMVHKRRRQEIDGLVLKRPWDLIAANPHQLVRDFEDTSASQGLVLDDPRIAVLGDPRQLRVDPAAEVDPWVVLDVRQGPITIAADVQIHSFTRIVGPCAVGQGTRLMQAIVEAGTTIGSACRVAGEVQRSILHGFVNKCHDGHLGHSYVCPWVNLGAGTTNSDLKNDYSSVRVPVTGESIDSGQIKVGAFIGDHVKTGLGSLFNTGSSIGVCAMILPAGRLLPKYVPPFCRVWNGELADSWDVERILDTARTAMGRRDRKLSIANQNLLRQMFAATCDARKQAVDSAHRRAADPDSRWRRAG